MVENMSEVQKRISSFKKKAVKYAHKLKVIFTSSQHED